MKIDYIRLYQDVTDSSHTFGCSPKKFPTDKYIAQNAHLFADWKPLSSESAAIYWRNYYIIVVVLSALGVVLLLFAIYYSDCKGALLEACKEGSQSKKYNRLPPDNNGALERGDSQQERSVQIMQHFHH